MLLEIHACSAPRHLKQSKCFELAVGSLKTLTAQVTIKNSIHQNNTKFSGPNVMCYFANIYAVIAVDSIKL